MLQFFKRAASTVGTAASGKVRFFVDTDDVPKFKTDTGALVSLVGPQGAQGFDGWEPILAVVNDGERRVLRLTDWTGGGGTKPTAFVGQYLGPNGFTADIAQATDIRGPQGQTGVTPTQNTFANISVGTTPTPTLLASDAAADILTINAGTGISLTADAAADSLTIVNADTGSAARTAHEAAADPHPQYTTTAEAAAAAPVQSVAGKTGAVTLVKGDVGLANIVNPVAVNVHTTAPQTLNQTLTAVATMTIPANTLQAGDAFEFDVFFATLVNTTAASNLDVAVFVNGAQNAIATAAMGTTAVAAPGRGGAAYFKLVFRAVGAAGTAVANGVVQVNALANFASNNAAAQAVNTTANVTIDIRARTSAATTTGTVQFAAIEHTT